MPSWFTSSASRALLRELPSLAVAVTITELFFRFGSFTLEALACGAVWVLVAQVSSAMQRAVGRATTEPDRDGTLP